MADIDDQRSSILVTGATGYIGGRLVALLLKHGYHVRCLSRNAARLDGRFPGAQIAEGDVFDENSLRAACAGVDTAYYLVHSMSAASDFAQLDRRAAELFGRVARECGLRRIIYLGGLGNDHAKLSHHLRSRHEVGEVLRECGVQVIEFRAAVIIGSGSVSFEMMRYLTERLPVMIAPKWVATRSQPIAVGDVLAYLIEALEIPRGSSRVYDIGGRDVLTYGEMMMRYAKLRNLKRRMLIVPLFTPRLSSYWVHLVTPISSRIAQPLIIGLYNETIVRDGAAARDFPRISPVDFETALVRALDRYQAAGPETTWFDAFDARPLPAQFSGMREGMLIDRRERHTRASPHQLAMIYTQLGGERGWLASDRLWRLRGMLDRVVGGVGLRRGRRSPTELRLGDVVDFWRVDAYEADRLLRLRAEMRLPGTAWLEFSAERNALGATCFVQTAFYEPRGLFGYLYWYVVTPFHAFVFDRMASQIVRLAEQLPTAAA